MKVIKIKDGTEACNAVFLQRYIVKGSRKEELTNAYGQVILLYKDSTIEMMKRKNKRLLGMASFRLMSGVPIQEMFLVHLCLVFDSIDRLF
jgi:hypothetical protein